MNGLILNGPATGVTGLHLKPALSAREAVKRLEACMKRFGVMEPGGGLTPTRAALDYFCVCNTEVVQEEFSCHTQLGAERKFTDNDCKTIANDLKQGGIAMLVLCRGGDPRHIVTAASLSCSDGSDAGDGVGAGTIIDPYTPDVSKPVLIGPGGVTSSDRDERICGFLSKAPYQAVSIDPEVSKAVDAGIAVVDSELDLIYSEQLE
ncbi:MAG: hypothetical protein K1X79_01665 [Oligoflexia bacterium]|nr:hypothetical protein [Oligoflexia bacterium]